MDTCMYLRTHIHIQESVAHDKSTYHVTDQKMSRYFDWLDGQEEAKKVVHDKILKQDG